MNIIEVENESLREQLKATKNLLIRVKRKLNGTRMNNQVRQEILTDLDWIINGRQIKP